MYNVGTHLLHISTGSLAQGRDGIDGRNALGQEGVGSQLGKLSGPQVGSQHTLSRDPVSVHPLQSSNSSLATLSVRTTNQNLQ